MPTELIGVASIVVIVTLVFLRVPVAVSMGIVGTLGYAIVDDFDSALNRLAATPFELSEGYSLSVVPLFILMGAVAARSGMSQDLFKAANALFAGRRGTVAMAAVGACAAFGAICGSSLATAATMSRIAIPEMRRLGYDERLATGAVASGGTLGILIPPSVILIIYAVIAQASVAQLFAAGLLPGLVLTVLHVIVIACLVAWRPNLAPAVSQRRMSLTERMTDIAGIWQMAVLFIIAVGGIYAGFFSPTEAAAVGSLAAILLGFATRKISVAALLDAAAETVRTTAVLFFIVIMAFVYSYFLVLTQLPQGLVEYVVAAQWSPMAVIIALVLFYLILGCFLDALGMILVTVPVFLPLVVSLGFSPIWFGVLLVIVVEIGLITPPVGMNLFVIKAQLPDISLQTLYRGVLPFLSAGVTLIVLLLIFPELALWLPGRLFG